jgi:4-amino-4-deoxy-L-arabinose transferase-like glycosyltransferase
VAFPRRLGIVVAAGAVVRVLYTVLVAPWPPPPLDDQSYFHLLPEVLVQGHGFVQPHFAQIGRFVATAAHPPLYSVVLAGPAALGVDDPLVQRLTGTVFGSITVLCVGLLGRRLAGDRAGLLAAGLAAAYPILITADGALMSESLYGALIGGSLLAAMWLRDRPSPARAATLGALIGLATLTRGEAFVLLGLLLLAVVRRPGGVRASIAAVAAMIVVLTPWTVRNWVTFDRFVLISTDSGAVVGGANCAPTYSGSNIGGWSILCDRDYPGNEAEETDRQRRDGTRYALHHVGRWPKVVVARLLRQASFLRPFQANPGRSAWVQDVGVVVYWALLPLALYGAVTLRRRRIPSLIVLAPVALVIIQAVLIYGFLRFRHPAELSLCVLAGVGLDAALRRREATRRDRAAAPAPDVAVA